jgi:hypothetical protein
MLIVMRGLLVDRAAVMSQTASKNLLDVVAALPATNLHVYIGDRSLEAWK